MWLRWGPMSGFCEHDNFGISLCVAGSLVQSVWKERTACFSSWSIRPLRTKKICPAETSRKTQRHMPVYITAKTSELSRSLTSGFHKIKGISWAALRPIASQEGPHLHAVLTHVPIWVTCNSASYLGYVSATTAPKIIPASVCQLIVTSRHLPMCRPRVWIAWRTYVTLLQL